MRAAFFVSAALLLIPTRARAETGVALEDTSYDACDAVDAVVPSALPANVPGIPVLGSVDTTTASLLAADGTVIPTALIADLTRSGTSILVIKATLTPGVTYSVRWTDGCSGYRVKSFLAEKIVEFPATAGTAYAGDEQYGGFAGSCDELGQPRMSVARSIFLKASPELTPFLAISTAELVVEGTGKAAATVGFYPGGYTPGARIGAVDHRCPTSADAGSIVSVRIRIPYGPTLVTPLITVRFACPVVPPAPCTPPAGVDPEAGANDDMNDDGADVARYGCATKRTGSSGVEWVFVLLSAFALRRATRGAAP